MESEGRVRRWSPSHGIRTMESEGRVRRWSPNHGIRTMESEGRVRRRSPKEESEGGARGNLRQVLQLFGRPNLGDLYASSSLHQQCNVSIYEYSLHSGTASSRRVRLVLPYLVVFLVNKMIRLESSLCFILHALIENFARGLAGIEPGVTCSARLDSI